MRREEPLRRENLEPMRGQESVWCEESCQRSGLEHDER